MDNLISLLKLIIPLQVIGAAIGITLLGSLIGFLFIKVTQSLAFTKGEWRSHHQYTAGGRGSYFFDADLILSTDMGVELTANWIADKIEDFRKAKHIDKMAFIEEARGPVGLLTQKDLLVSRTGMPGIIVRFKRRLVIGRITGHIKRGESFVLISDTGTTGRKMTRAIRCLQDAACDIKVPYAITLVNLNQGAEESLKKMGTELISYKSIHSDKPHL